jgi:transposase
LQEITDIYLGKSLILTNREEWTDCQVITAYRGQYIIEDVFKEAKDRDHGSWWPQYHWTDSKIHVHGLYCTIALLLRGLIWRRTQKANIKISMDRILTELEGVREVINIYQGKGKKEKHEQTVLTKLSEIQERLMAVLDIPKTGQGAS